MVLAGLLVVAIGLVVAVLEARPRLAPDRHGDAALLRVLGEPDGLNAVAVVVVQRGRPARYAGIGADEHRSFEIGSNSKTITGMLLADAVRRGEVALGDRLGRWLDLGTAQAADVTLLELATHTSGLPRDGAFAEQTWCWVTGANCVAADLPALLDDLRRAGLTGRGTASYSNLGAAALGQALARAAGTTYGELARRVTQPLGMTATRVQDPSTGPLAERGYQPWGLRPENWVMDGYQAAGGFVSTAADLGRYLGGILAARAPGPDALVARTAIDAARVADLTDTRVGLLWMTARLEGHRIAFHTGETAGYRSALMIDFDAGRGVAVLSNVNTPVGAIAQRLLRQG